MNLVIVPYDGYFKPQGGFGLFWRATSFGEIVID